MKNVIAIVGRFASGKTACVEYIKKKYDYDIYEIGDYVRRAYNDHAKKEQTLIEFAESFYRQGKIDQFIKEAILEASKTNRNIVFSGVKSVAELKCLQHSYPNLFLARIDAPRSERKKRYTKELKDKAPFDVREAIEEVWIHDLWETASFDFTVLNHLDYGSLFREIDDMMCAVQDKKGG